ncbi:PAS domain S-box protein [uncultured Cohaesibacter sp.]|uniref:PAS domain-containing protein n=1 Tax=uncultured Cohaesibacter sp. TaxID=1002546 RepID=UPI0029C745B4|nr:PAS domain S-box protein [uncultured Cohaesibacter sp.]
MLDAFWDKSPLRSVIDSLLFEPGKLCESEKARHAWFIGIHLSVGALALAFLPIVILAATSPLEADVSALALLPLWMLAPLLSVFYLSRTGNLTNAFLLTASTTAAFIVLDRQHDGRIAIASSRLARCHPAGSCVVKQPQNHQTVSPHLLCCSWGPERQRSDRLCFNQHRWGRLDCRWSGRCLSWPPCCMPVLLAIRVELLHRGRLCELQAEEMRYRSIADTVSDMITRHDRSGDVTFASPTAETLVNARPESLMGNGLFQKIHIPDRPAFLQALSDCMNRGKDEKQPVTVEVRIMADEALTDERNGEATRGDRLRWCEMTCAPERDENGKITGAIASTRDISKRKQQQSAMEEARAEAEQANESKTRFLRQCDARASHAAQYHHRIFRNSLPS